MNLKHASILSFIIAALSLAALALQGSLLAAGPVAIAVQVVAALLMVWARLTFGRRSFHAGANATEGGLVTSGPYACLRHPIYAAVLYFTWAGVGSHPSILSISLGGLATAGMAVRMLAEERLLAQRYPEYAAYASRTKRVVPFVF